MEINEQARIHVCYIFGPFNSIIASTHDWIVLILAMKLFLPPIYRLKAHSSIDYISVSFQVIISMPIKMELMDKMFMFRLQITYNRGISITTFVFSMKNFNFQQGVLISRDIKSSIHRLAPPLSIIISEIEMLILIFLTFPVCCRIN